MYHHVSKSDGNFLITLFGINAIKLYTKRSVDSGNSEETLMFYPLSSLMSPLSVVLLAILVLSNLALVAYIFKIVIVHGPQNIHRISHRIQ